ncbi:MAG: hypothetical protein JWN86_2682 [Planctomycetota bacterium]|nr:hypothetical protein [Planctomycetota bacterium]
MTIYLLKRVTFFEDSKSISDAQYAAFHGVAFRKGAAFPFGPKATLHNDEREPIHLIRSYHIAPPITNPCENLVVQQAIAGVVGGWKNATFLEVVIEKLVDFHYEKGDFTYERYEPDGTYLSPEQFITELPDNAEAHQGFPNYLELLSPLNDEVKVAGSQRAVVEIGPTRFDDPIEFWFSEVAFREYPLQKKKTTFLLDGRLFDSIAAFIDWDFFMMKSVEVD